MAFGGRNPVYTRSNRAGVASFFNAEPKARQNHSPQLLLIACLSLFVGCYRCWLLLVVVGMAATMVSDSRYSALDNANSLARYSQMHKFYSGKLSMLNQLGGIEVQEFVADAVTLSISRYQHHGQQHAGSDVDRGNSESDVLFLHVSFEPATTRIRAADVCVG
jgi:hypothetical protein